MSLSLVMSATGSIDASGPVSPVITGSVITAIDATLLRLVWFFNGVTGKITVPVGSYLNKDSGAIAVHYKRRFNTDQYLTIVDGTDWADAKISQQFYGDPANVVSIGNLRDYWLAEPTVANVWETSIVAWSNGMATTYVNGVADSAMTDEPMVLNPLSGNFQISGNTLPFTGYINQVALYDERPHDLTIATLARANPWDIRKPGGGDVTLTSFF
jgi:hypothetical protein